MPGLFRAKGIIDHRSRVALRRRDSDSSTKGTAKVTALSIDAEIDRFPPASAEAPKQRGQRETTAD